MRALTKLFYILRKSTDAQVSRSGAARRELTRRAVPRLGRSSKEPFGRRPMFTVGVCDDPQLLLSDRASHRPDPEAPAINANYRALMLLAVEATPNLDVEAGAPRGTDKTFPGEAVETLERVLGPISALAASLSIPAMPSKSSASAYSSRRSSYSIPRSSLPRLRRWSRKSCGEGAAPRREASITRAKSWPLASASLERQPGELGEGVGC